MSDMDDLVEWLRAQLDEDERVAKASTWHEDTGTWKAEPSPYGAGSSPGPRWYIDDSMDDGVISDVNPQASDAEGVARHIARQDPAHVLNDVAAKRLIVAEHDTDKRWPLDRSRMGCKTCRLRGDIAVDDEWPCLTLRLLAAGYRDRPGYQEEWRP